MLLTGPESGGGGDSRAYLSGGNKGEVLGRGSRGSELAFQAGWLYTLGLAGSDESWRVIPKQGILHKGVLCLASSCKEVKQGRGERVQLCFVLVF